MPLNGYSVFVCTLVSSQSRAATAPSVQWPAVRTTVGDRSDAEQRQAGCPGASSNTSRPTYGWLFPSGVPLVIASAAVEPPSTTVTTAATAVSLLRRRI